MPPAAAVGGAAVGGGVLTAMGNQSIQNGMGAQADATVSANQTLANAYNEQKNYASPYLRAGTSALKQMQDPYFQKNFGMSDFQEDPGYQFRMDQGMKALQASAAARGGLLGGNTLTGIQNYSQGLASQEYQGAYDRFTNNQNQRFGRLSSIAGMGANMTGQIMGDAGSYGSQVSNNITGLGNARAAGDIAIANNYQQLGSNLMSMGSSMAKPGPAVK